MLHYYIIVFILLISNSAIAEDKKPGSAIQLTIENVEIFADADDLDTAKESAINTGAQKAFTRLLNKIVPHNSLWKIDGLLKQINSSDMIATVDIVKERMTSHSYKATYNYIFDANKIKHLLNKHGIEYAEKPVKVTLVVPILHQQDNKLIIWSKNEWRDVWNQIPEEIGLVEFLTTEGDLEDMELLDPSEVLTKPYAHFEKLLHLYEVTNMTVIFATEVTNGLEITIRFLDKGYDYSKYITIDKNPGEELIPYYTRVARSLLENIDSEWKGVRVFKEDKLYSSKINIKLAKSDQWPNTQKALESISSIKQIMLLEKNNDNVYVELIYNTPPAVLADQLAQVGYIMKEGADKKYYLATR